MKLEFIIPASPTPAFFSQIAMFRRSLDALGGHYAAARVVAVMDRLSQDDVSDFWRRQIGSVDVEYPTLADFKTSPSTQVDHLFHVISNHSDVCIFCNADTMFLNPFDLMLWNLRIRPAIAGVMAHKHFPWRPRKVGEAIPVDTIRQEWDEIASAVLGGTLDKPYRYSLVSPEIPCAAPFYVNFGLVAGTPKLIKSLFPVFKRILGQVDRLVGNEFSGQIALTLACAELRVKTKVLPMRFNFPNDRTADAMYPSEVKAIVMLHYLRHKQFDRHRIFVEEDEFARFTRLDLVGSDAIFQRHVRKLTGGIFPFPGAPRTFATPLTSGGNNP